MHVSLRLEINCHGGPRDPTTPGTVLHGIRFSVVGIVSDRTEFEGDPSLRYLVGETTKGRMFEEQTENKHLRTGRIIMHIMAAGLNHRAKNKYVTEKCERPILCSKFV